MSICPVCGFRGLPAPPTDFIICPCCGTEFGYDDFTHTHEQLRAAWLHNGAHWFSEFTGPPHGWNPYSQLLRAGLIQRMASSATVTASRMAPLKVTHEPLWARLKLA